MTRMFGLTAEQVDDLVSTVDRAPSPYDGRPWRIRVTPRAIELHAVADRTPPIAESDARAQRMARGAALFTLRLALHGHRIRPVVTLLPDRDRPDLLAVVRDGGTKEPTPSQTRLLRAVSTFGTDHRPFNGDAVSPPESHALRRAAIDEGAWLHLVRDEPGRVAVRALVRRADRLQRADPAVRAELARGNRSLPLEDGMPAGAGGADLEEEPLIAVLTSHLSGRTAEVQVGQALARVLLTASATGLATSLLGQVVDVPRTREELRRLIGGTRPPQAVLRVGYGRSVGTAPRRDDGYLLVQEHAAEVHGGT